MFPYAIPDNLSELLGSTTLIRKQSFPENIYWTELTSANGGH